MDFLRGRVARFGILCTIWFALLLASFRANAQSAIDDVNALYNTVSSQNRSDTALLGAIGNMTPAPEGALSERVGPSIVNEQSSKWTELATWAAEPTQQAALQALQSETKDVARGVRRAFALRYGVANVSTDLVASGMYVELGDPPLLGNAEYLYLHGISRLRDLANIEATRMIVQGEPKKSLDIMLNLVALGRQLMDREFPAEAAYGYQLSIDAIRRIRDIVYIDFHSDSPKLTAQDLVNISRVFEPTAELMRFDRLSFPRGSEFASRQMIEMTFGPNAKDKPNESFSQVIAQLSTGGHPLRLFGEMAHARTAAKSHADRYDSLDYAKRAQDDFTLRWRLKNDDAQLLQTLFVDSIDATKFAVVKVVYDDHARKLRNLRHMLETELVGTQIALGVVSFHIQNHAFPPSLAAIRPKFVTEVANDPFNRMESEGEQPWFGYFVPKLINVRDVDIRDEHKPHSINVVTQSLQNFSLLIDSDQFILYSAGPDGKPDRAMNVREDATEIFPGDYLVWPSVTSLYRRHLQETGAIN